MNTCLKSLFLFLSLGLTLSAEEPASEPIIILGAPFRDNMVLQRDMQVPVWGWSKPGTQVTVTFGGQTKTTVAVVAPKASVVQVVKWVIELDPLVAGFNPRQMVVTESIRHKNLLEYQASRSRTLKNVLVGEVWLASGQSNMQWKVNKSSCMKIAQAFIEGTKDKPAPIREFEVTSVVAMIHPIEKADGEWKNGDYLNYSAIAFAFAHKLYEELKVPIGILNCSFSQTAIQAWVPREGFRDAKDGYTQAIYQKILETDPASPEHKKAWSRFYADIEENLRKNSGRIARGTTPEPISIKTPGNMSGNRDASWLFNGRLNPVVPYAIRGGIWNQGYANMGEGLPYYNNLHSLVRGWRLVWERPELPVYFHQFYCPGQKGEWNHNPTIGGVADMRMGTWLARDIPNTGMASQIDVTGSIHYFSKAVPGQRLALHALKNQYQKKIVADGPSFKSYQVRGDKVIVEFANAKGGLVVGSTRYNTDRKNKDATGFANPTVIENGESHVKCFYLANSDSVWHPASVGIDGETVVLQAPGVKKPRGVSYGTGGIGFEPNLYNTALLPMTPFIRYDHKLVTAKDWPGDKLKVAGVVPKPGSEGLLYEWRKMPILSTQFRDNAVLQAGRWITFWGSVLHDYGHEAEGKAVIEFSFAGIKKTFPVTDGSPHIVELTPGETRYSGAAREWRFTVPPMKASPEPKTLTVRFLIDGELAHERICKDIVIGDVWFVAAPSGRFKFSSGTKPTSPVRMITRKAKRFSHPGPSRYTVCVSRTPLNRFASEWTNASGLAAALGNRIAAKTGNPVGIIFMQSANNLTTLKSWTPVNGLREAPSLLEDYEDLAAIRPGNKYYDANAREYVESWKTYWNEYVTQMIVDRAVPDGVAWGSYPSLASSVTTKASEVYNVMVHSFTPAELKGIIFLTSPAMVEQDQGAAFAEQMSALANSWKVRFGRETLPFIHTLPNKDMAPKIRTPKAIKGKSSAIPVEGWGNWDGVLDAVLTF
jgi:sialate O-acetylesterase